MLKLQSHLLAIPRLQGSAVKRVTDVVLQDVYTAVGNSDNFQQRLVTIVQMEFKPLSGSHYVIPLFAIAGPGVPRNSSRGDLT